MRSTWRQTRPAFWCCPKYRTRRRCGWWRPARDSRRSSRSCARRRRDRGARRARHAQAPATRTRPYHGGKFLVRALCALLVAALLSGCSAVRLVYDNADIYVRWRAAHYLDPDEAMAEELDERIAAYMAWHRTHSLPKYAQIADEARRRMERQLQPDDLVWGYDSVVAQLREDMRAAAESMAPLLDRLTPRQIAHFERRLAEDNRRFARENLRGGERERRKRRTERNVERLEDWLGRLSRAQLERVKQYSERAPLLDELRDRDHKRLQAQLLAMLRAKE